MTAPAAASLASVEAVDSPRKRRTAAPKSGCLCDGRACCLVQLALRHTRRAATAYHHYGTRTRTPETDLAYHTAME